jgi:hypothetical protein
MAKAKQEEMGFKQEARKPGIEVNRKNAERRTPNAERRRTER